MRLADNRNLIRAGDMFEQHTYNLCPQNLTLRPQGPLKAVKDKIHVQKGKSFTAWTKKYVYFPVCYEGVEWVGRAPRSPCDIATKHQGES